MIRFKVNLNLSVNRSVQKNIFIFSEKKLTLEDKKKTSLDYFFFHQKKLEELIPV